MIYKFPFELKKQSLACSIPETGYTRLHLVIRADRTASGNPFWGGCTPHQRKYLYFYAPCPLRIAKAYA